jgi:hypothetical protein
VDYVLLLGLLFTVVYAVWQRYQHIQSMKIKEALKEFVEKLVPCRVEVRSGEFFLFESITNVFLAQGQTPREVELAMPNDGRIYVNESADRDILAELNEYHMLDTIVDKSVVN